MIELLGKPEIKSHKKNQMSIKKDNEQQLTYKKKSKKKTSTTINRCQIHLKCSVQIVVMINGNRSKGVNVDGWAIRLELQQFSTELAF